jgi:hypothetical protein
MPLDKTKQQIFVLDEINHRIDAINAAVKGADFLDKSHQSGISILLGDVWCRLDDLINEMKGDSKAEGEANGQN